MPQGKDGRSRRRVQVGAGLGILDELEKFRLEADDEDLDDPILIDADGKRVETWRESYPYDERLSHGDYEQQKRQLQIELLKLQNWAQANGERVLVLFEGRDAAGKGGTIKRFMEHLNPRAARVVALDKPTEREQGEWYFQRYVRALPTAGEIVLFDRSWYNRGGVEVVMGWVSKEKHNVFLNEAPIFEKLLVDDGIRLIKLWFSVSQQEQRTRFLIRSIDPVRQWKLSPTDLALLDRWDDYTHAKEDMFQATDTDYAPWTVIRSNDKRRARVEAMRLVLNRIPYDHKDLDVVTKPDSSIVGPPWRIYEQGERKPVRPPARAPRPSAAKKDEKKAV
jgi:polyphosphate kinase 2